MTVQQHQFWNAVQLKRVIADFKSMIKYCDDRAIDIPPVPIALDSALRQADHGEELGTWIYMLNVYTVHSAV